MKFAILYYSGYMMKDKERVERPSESIEKFVKDNPSPDGATIFVRQAEAFDGEAEMHEGQYPRGVLLAGDGAAIDKVRKAYEALEVEVAHVDIDDDGNADLKAFDPPKSDVNLRHFDDLDELKEYAIKLGVTFNPAIGFNTLEERVIAKMDEMEERGESLPTRAGSTAFRDPAHDEGKPAGDTGPGTGQQ